MRLVDTIKNIWKIEDLRKRILITILYVVIYRLGSFVVLPGVNPDTLTSLASQTSEGLMALLNMFSGGAFSNASIFALGIMPYISASIVMQLAAIIIPSMQKMQREGESGRRKINQWTRYLTVLILLIQAPAYLLNLDMQLRAAGASLPSGFMYRVFATVILAAGSMFVLWLGERITDKGVGNGISLIIFAGIVAALPKNLGTIYHYVQAGTISYFSVFMFGVIALAMVVFVIHVETGFRRIPISYAKRVVGQRAYGGHSSHIPLKVNQAGVIPIIFASSVLMFPVTVAQFIDVPWVKTVASYLEWGKPLQTALYVGLIIFFTYFYTAVTVKIPDMADNLKKYGGFIPGIRPGKPTADYLDHVLTRITLAGSVFLAFIAVLPNMIAAATHIEGVYFGGTALLIVVGVALQTMKQIESMVVMRHYEGFMK